MSFITYLKYTILISLFFGISLSSLFAQILTEIDGPTEVKMNSDGVFPQLNLIENADNKFSRLHFTNTNNLTDKWALAGTVGTSAEHGIGIFYNNISRFYYNNDAGGLGLGIGFTDPQQLLHLNFTGTNGIYIQGDGTGDARGMFLNNAGGSHFIFDDVSNNNNLVVQSANELEFWTGGTNKRMIINQSNGAIGINGGENQFSRLGLLSNEDNFGIFVEQLYTGLAYGIHAETLAHGDGSKYGLSGIITGTDGGGPSYGIYGMASTTPSNFWAGYANGDFWYTGDLKAPSDRRLKKNIQDLEPVLSKVLQLETKTYEFDHDTYSGLNLAQGPQIGFIAQNVESLFPSLVEEEKHSYTTDLNNETGNITQSEIDILGLNSISMIPILTKALQEQQVLIEEQKELLNDQQVLLNGQQKVINELMSDVAQLKSLNN